MLYVGGEVEGKERVVSKPGREFGCIKCCSQKSAHIRL